jgi:hypothetical protein
VGKTGPQGKTGKTGPAGLQCPAGFTATEFTVKGAQGSTVTVFGCMQ